MDLRVSMRSRSPHGERGLKFGLSDTITIPERRSPHGERGLKLGGNGTGERYMSRSPHGERGLKCNQRIKIAGVAPVAPRMGSVG